MDLFHGSRFEMRPKKAEGTTSRAPFTLTTYSAVSLKEPSAFPVVITTKPLPLPFAVIKFYSETTFMTFVSNFVLRL